MYQRYALRISALGLGVLAVLAGYAFASSGKHVLPLLRVIPKPASGMRSAVIGARGGSLQVRTPTGTSVRLVIPAEALSSNTTITLTPLARVKHVPFKRGVVGAVRLGPEGLVLARPAKLLFRPRHAVSRKLQTGFSATGTGDSFHIYPDADGRVMSVPLMHFSIYGEAEASKQERLGEATRKQGSREAAIERDLAESASDQALADQFEPLAKHVADEVAQALTDDSLVPTAVDDALSLAEELRVAGWSSEVVPDMGNAIPASVAGRLGPIIRQIRASFPDKLLANALRRALDRCEAAHTQKSRDAVLSVLELQRTLGVTDQIDLSVLDRCYGYKLVYTHRVAGSISYHYDHSSQNYVDYGDYTEHRNLELSAEVPLTLASDGSYRGSGPLRWLNHTWSEDNENTGTSQAGKPCSIDFNDTLTGVTTGTLSVSSLTLGDHPSADVTLAHLWETWQSHETSQAGGCPVFDSTDTEARLLGLIFNVYEEDDDFPQSTSGGSGQHGLSSVEVKLDSGWQAGQGDIVATRTLSGKYYDQGPDGTQDIPYTDTYKLVRLSN